MRVGRYWVCERGRTGVRVGDLLGVSEGLENRGEGGGDIVCIRGRGTQV